MHVRRGDAIFFVTGRSPTKTETVSKTLADNFHIPVTNMNPVIFAGDKPGQNTKSQWLQDKNIRIFYGDSDNDITAARDVGVRYPHSARLQLYLQTLATSGCVW